MRFHLTALSALPTLLLAVPAAAQGVPQPMLYTLTQSEQTISGSGGTSLANLGANEIIHLDIPCPLTAEKWAPRAVFQVQAGDEDGDDQYWEPSLFGQVDALQAPLTAAGTAGGTTPRSVYYSPRTPMGTIVSGGPGLRPGDVGRIRRVGASDGQVEYFIRAEQVQIALGLPATPTFVNVDAFAAGFNYGVFFSLEDDTPCSLCTGAVLVRDGDVLMIPPAAVTWSSSGTVAAVVPGSAVVIYTEAQMDLMVANARVTDRFGACQNQIIDTDALEIDMLAPFAGAVPSCFGTATPFPHLVFAGESLTGGAILQTQGGGTIRPSSCGQYGTNCPFGPTLGDQIGIRPAGPGLGIASSVNGITFARVCRFTTQSPTPQAPVGSPVTIDVGAPAPAVLMFVSVAPPGPGAVPASAPFPLGLLCYPDFYPAPTFMGLVVTPGGFGTYVSPPVPFAIDLVWQAATVLGTSWEASTPTITESF